MLSLWLSRCAWCDCLLSLRIARAMRGRYRLVNRTHGMCALCYEALVESSAEAEDRA